VAISFALGEGARKEYTLLARCEGVEKRETLPFKHPTFDEVGWLGISAADDADGVFYLDNLELKIE
jgi:hypothetical protein